ncbi:MAG: helix-turn-helix transcriptional regulator, partial [FCB group bacterium]|nr:helix-turn-helix transcriptional regulator [FCB group bacterium]
MAEPVEGLQPSVLRWARESQGYAIGEIAIRLKRSESDIIAWESGAASPTYSQLEKLAYEVYKRPLAVFFLPAPPPEPHIKEQFRALPDFEIELLSPDTRYQLRLADSYRHSLWELSDGVNPVQDKIFRDLKITERDNVQEAAGTVRDYLKVTMRIQASWKSSDEALKTWRNRVEEAGVFVFKHAIKQQE